MLTPLTEVKKRSPRDTDVPKSLPGVVRTYQSLGFSHTVAEIWPLIYSGLSIGNNNEGRF